MGREDGRGLTRGGTSEHSGRRLECGMLLVPGDLSSPGTGSSTSSAVCFRASENVSLLTTDRRATLCDCRVPIVL